MTTFHIDRKKNLKATVHTGTIGSRHDPYGYTEITIKLPHGKEACLYTDGLGTSRFELTENFEPVRYLELLDGCDNGKEVRRKRSQWELKCNLLAKRHMGLTFSAVKELYHRMPQDPMGPASRYI